LRDVKSYYKIKYFCLIQKNHKKWIQTLLQNKRFFPNPQKNHKKWIQTLLQNKIFLPNPKKIIKNGWSLIIIKNIHTYITFFEAEREKQKEEYVGFCFTF